ncbi:hypothetical protein FHW69_001420 [Luteibacter sp. Sphag1AF]|uniref:hypothetical protein n=1 Tax=Luteibacter sp. Sphag1AF TaxID=2587031 RepID=UPI00179CA5E0|nr:hypothetical protein [Luteibacter sp. Sphag1AF]MBB3226819.1 hypothetical protein [Luteibacter sp. Sphag1AF]
MVWSIFARFHERADMTPHLPVTTDFPPGAQFIIKEFDVPLVHIPGEGYFNWFGGNPRTYDPTNLKVDNHWPATSFEEWVALIADSM